MNNWYFIVAGVMAAMGVLAWEVDLVSLKAYCVGMTVYWFGRGLRV